VLCIPPPQARTPDGISRAVAHRSYLWRKDDAAPAGVWCFVDVLFLSGEAWQREECAAIIEGPNGWNRACGVQFRFNDAPNAPVRVTFERGSSWSQPGNYGVLGPFDRPTLNLGWFSEKAGAQERQRIALHEFGHALALQHEHEFPGAPIPWDKPAVYAYYAAAMGWDADTVDAQLFAPLAAEVAESNYYDPLSIMHYAIPAALLTEPLWATETNYVISDGDRDLVQRLYGPPPYIAPPPVVVPVEPPPPPPEPVPEQRRVYLPYVPRNGRPA
jgi:hypothetical protein